MLPTILTSRGQYFDFSAPERSVFGVAEIAHALAHICRFTGHCSQFYSVAQHAVLASYVVQPEHAYAALHHDDAEAFIGDVAKPLKLLLPDYQAIEARVEAAVLERMGILLPLHPSIKWADKVMLATEQRDLMPKIEEPWACLQGVEPLDFQIKPWTPELAENAFLRRHRELQASRGHRDLVTDPAEIERLFAEDQEREDGSTP